ncbi:MAG: DUF4238 domain-containing protein [Firmicutes bacterium]|nr:DUF4238 domain-containing protein [Bacillota bacterium]
MQNRTRNCHYVPRILQSSWEDSDRKIYYFDKANNFVDYVDSEHKMSGRDYYDMDGSNDEIEDFLNNYETDFKKIINTLGKGYPKSKGEYKSLINLLDKNKQALIVDRLASLQYSRIYENNTKNFGIAIALACELWTEKFGNFEGIEKEIDKILVDDNFKQQIFTGTLKSGKEVATPMEGLINLFSNFDVCYMYVKDDTNFVLSDNPVIKINERQIIFPLTPKWCVVYEIDDADMQGVLNEGAAYKRADKRVIDIGESESIDAVKSINRVLIENCMKEFGNIDKKLDKVI